VNKKLIEVALPLPEINDAFACSKMPGTRAYCGVMISLRRQTGQDKQTCSENSRRKIYSFGHHLH
jgi:hypothetical protein